MIDSMTASESHPAPDLISSFPLGSFAWPDAAQANALWARQGFVTVLLDTNHLPALPQPLMSEVMTSRQHADSEGFLARRRAIRALAACILGGVPERIIIGQTRSGAPYLENADLSISFSSRAPISAVALAQRPVGVDVERIVPVETIPWNMLRQGEREALLALPPPRQGEAFTRLWAAKEAYAKALGQGFLLPPETLVIEPGGVARFRPLDGQSSLPTGVVSVTRLDLSGDNMIITALALLSS